METLLSLKNQSEDFAVEFDILPAMDIGEFQNGYLQKINREIFTLDGQLAENQRRIDELNAEIDRLTNHADRIDYAIAVTCGIITGMIDSIVVGEWDFKKAKAISDKKNQRKGH